MVNGDKSTEWNDLQGSKADVSVRNGIISIHSSRKEESLLRDRTFTVTDQQKAGYVGYYGLFKLTTKFAVTGNTARFEVVSANKSASRFNNWLLPDYTSYEIEIDPPSYASTGARWSFRINNALETQYDLSTYSYQE